MQIVSSPLYLPEQDFLFLFEKFGPSLGLWRAAEIAALRTQVYAPPVLDLGCGDGLVTSRVLPRVEIGLDPDARALRRAADLGVYQLFLPLEMSAARLPPGSLGSLISNSVLEHVPDIDATLAAAARVLRPGGRLVFTTPTEAFSRWLAWPSAGYAAARNRHFQHLNLWPIEEWARRLSALGLEVECAYPLLRRGWVEAWDALELAQMARAGQVRLFGRAWKALPPAWLRALARRAARIDLSSPAPGGGRMVVARKIGD